METMRLVAVIVLISCSAVFAAADAPPAPGAGGGQAAMPCIQKLMPCQPYLHAPNPPPTCCVPLKEAFDKDTTCLCTVFNNPDLLRSFNITKSNALDLPKACGIEVDLSRCGNKAATPSTSPATPGTPMTPPASTNGSSSTGGSTTGGSSSAVAATVSFVGFNFVSALVATIFL